jgi:Guanylylate cyclase
VFSLPRAETSTYLQLDTGWTRSLLRSLHTAAAHVITWLRPCLVCLLLRLVLLLFRQMLLTRSVWTVDLAHLLAGHGCRVHFFTLTVGANPDYARERFYQGQLGQDKGRVERLFVEAKQAGIDVHQRSLPWQEIRDFLANSASLFHAKPALGLVSLQGQGFAAHHLDNRGA